MPYKDLEKRKSYHRRYYINNKKKWDYLKISRKLFPWKHTFIKIKQRCNNPNNQDYKYYGGRGIKCLITEEELKKLWFRDKAYNLTKPSIDRKDNDGNYEYGNCRYIELGQNSVEANTRTKNKFILQHGLNGTFIKEWKSITEASIAYHCCVSNIWRNLQLKNKTACGFIWRYK